MSSIKHKQNHIFNSNLQLFAVFCLCAILYLGIVLDYWYFLLLILLPLAVRRVKQNQYQAVFYLGIILLFVLLIIFIPSFSLVEFIRDKLESVGAFKFKDYILNFLDTKYSTDVASYIKLVLFNIKSTETLIFYNQTVNLGIVWLIGTGGFHISLITRLICRIFKKRKILARGINISFVVFFTYMLVFSYACLRILIKLIFSSLFYKHKIERYDRLGAIGLTICLFNPSCFLNYSFMLSFIVCISSYFVIGLELNNKIIVTLLINIFAWIFTIPFIIDMNNKISILTFINSFIFSYPFAFIFLYFLFFAWMPFLAGVHKVLTIGSFAVVGNISFSNVFIYSGVWKSWAKSAYYCSFVFASKAFYLIVKNNKI